MVRNKVASGVGIIAGILLIITGINGVAAIDTIRQVVEEHISKHTYIGYIFSALIIIASLGGITVILGSVLIYKEKVRIGKFLVSIGAGIGIIDIIIIIVLWSLEGMPSLTIGFAAAFGGMVLSVVTTLVAKKPPKSMYICPQCGHHGIFDDQIHRWYCPSCRIYIP